MQHTLMTLRFIKLPNTTNEHVPFIAVTEVLLTKDACKCIIHILEEVRIKSNETICLCFLSFNYFVYIDSKSSSKSTKSCQSHWWVAQVPDSLQIFITSQSIDAYMNIMKQSTQYLLLQLILIFALTLINGKYILNIHPM